MKGKIRRAPFLTATLLPGGFSLSYSPNRQVIFRQPLTRGAVFDLQLLATMLGNGVRTIYTFNRQHFERFVEIDVLTP